MSAEAAQRHAAQAWAAWEAGRYADAIPLLRRAIGATEGRAWELERWLVDTLLLSESPHDQEEGVRRAGELAEEPGGPLRPEERAHLMARRAWALVVPPTPYPAAVAEAERDLARGAQLHPTGRPDVATLALVRLREGRFGEAAALTRELGVLDGPPAAPSAGEGGPLDEVWSRPYRAETAALDALCRAHVGDLEGAHAALDVARALHPHAALLAEAAALLAGPEHPPSGGPPPASPALRRTATVPWAMPPGGVPGSPPSGAPSGSGPSFHGGGGPESAPGAPAAGGDRSPPPAQRRWSPVGRPAPGQLGGSRVTPLVVALIVANVAVFVATGFGSERFVERFGMISAQVHAGEWYRVVTSAFVHLSFAHIALNMVSLAIIGSPLELSVGRLRFAAIYVLSALGGSAGVYLLASPALAAAGASGAIFGLLGAYVVVARLRGYPTTTAVALVVLNLAISFTISGIAWQAHVGGLVVGVVVAFGFMAAERLRPRTRPIAETLVVLGVAGAMASLFLEPPPALLALGAQVTGAVVPPLLSPRRTRGRPPPRARPPRR